VRLVEERAGFYAVLNAAAGVVTGLGAAFVGYVVAQAVWP
jgi:fluoride ion exporter CrcB/FEX